MTAATPLVERIASKVARDSSGCWVWPGALDKDGYGRIKVPGRGAQRVHRMSYEVFVGPIPAGLQLDHLCRNRRCCNPRHLEAVTQTVNVRRGARDRKVRGRSA